MAMPETVTLKLPGTVARSAREVANRKHKSMEDVLMEWLYKAATELPVESLSEEQILALCDMELEPEEQAELSRLLVKAREGKIVQSEHARLDKLMQHYRQGLVRKAEAWQVAVSRGLRPPLQN
jgi:hypothetical protein